MMKYKFNTHNECHVETSGTSLQGYLSNVSFDRLKECFGEPSDFYDDYKSDAEWDILFKDGEIATIYNYKNGRNYNGSTAPKVEDIVNWNIGGHKGEVVRRIREII